MPEDRAPLTELVVPDHVAEIYWRYLGGTGASEVSPKNPYQLIFDVLSLEPENKGWNGEYSLLSSAGRSVMSRDEPHRDWQLSNGAAMIWISRKWTVDETISTVLQSGFFGNGFHGIDSAALGYLDKSLNALDASETLYLLTMSPAPTRYNPWCYPSTHRERFEYDAARIGLDVDYDSVEVLPAPKGACN